MWHASDLLNIEAAENINQGLTRITTREIQESPITGTAATMSILHDSGKSWHWDGSDHVHIARSSSCQKTMRMWIPHSLPDEQRQVRVGLCEFMLRKVNGSRSKWTWEALTGDETWIYRYDPETRTVMQSAVWLSQEITQRTEEKKIVAYLFRKLGHVATIPLEDRRALSAD